MSSISSVASVTNPYQNAGVSGAGQWVQDFQAIGSALQTGNLPNAQSALATFQQALQRTSQTTATQPFGSNGQANTDFQSLTSDLKAGDLAGARKAFNSLQHDLQPAQSTQSARKGHHHHHAFAANSTAATASATSTSTSGGSLNLTA
jgi:hypothetical protein